MNIEKERTTDSNQNGDVDIGGKRTIYVVHSDAEIEKRAEFLNLFTNLIVGCFSNHFHRDISSKEAWDGHQKAFQVLIMSAQTYLSAIRSNFMKVEHANTIIFDDCNDFDTRNDMFKIVKYLDDVKEEDKPRILALSTRFLNTEFPQDNHTEFGLKELEKLYNASVRVAKECYMDDLANMD